MCQLSDDFCSLFIFQKPCNRKYNTRSQDSFTSQPYCATSYSSYLWWVMNSVPVGRGSRKLWSVLNNMSKYCNAPAHKFYECNCACNRSEWLHTSQLECNQSLKRFYDLMVESWLREDVVVGWPEVEQR